MGKIAKLVSLITLSLVVVPCFLFFMGVISLDGVKLSALIGTVGWFVSTPMWMGRDLSIDANEVEL